MIISEWQSETEELAGQHKRPFFDSEIDDRPDLHPLNQVEIARFKSIAYPEPPRFDNSHVRLRFQSKGLLSYSPAVFVPWFLSGSLLRASRQTG